MSAAARQSSRLSDRLAVIRQAGGKALTAFITAGDPDLTATVPALQALVAGGADVLELGVPFSDPEAEGPAIQASSERGLANGTTLSGCLEMVREFRAGDDTTPMVLMGYLNSIIAYGYARFAADAAAAGVDGLIMVNLPPEEAAPLKAELDAHHIDLIVLVAPTTTDTRARAILEQGAGFIYYVSLKGITGAGHLEVEPVAERVRFLKGETDLPILVGFGIKGPEAARSVAEHADGVVIGSALVRTMGEAADPEDRLARLRDQIGAIRKALDA